MERVLTGSSGWQWRFCQRHGICNLSLQGKKLSADPDAAAAFIPIFVSDVENENLIWNQIFNCNRALLSSFAREDSSCYPRKICHDRKKEKDNAYSNASGSIKLSIQLLEKQSNHNA